MIQHGLPVADKVCCNFLHDVALLYKRRKWLHLQYSNADKLTRPFCRGDLTRKYFFLREGGKHAIVWEGGEGHEY